MFLKTSESNSCPLWVRKLDEVPKYAIQKQNTTSIIFDLSFDFILDFTLYLLKLYIKWKILVPLIAFMSIDTISLKCFAKEKPALGFGYGLLIWFGFQF